MGMQHTPLLMARLIDRGATVAPEAEIVTATQTGTRRQTYRETRDRAHQLSHALRDAGIGVGDRVGTFMWNGSRHLEAYYATAGMGAVLHTLNLRLSDHDLEYIINHGGDRLIIADADALPLLERLAGRIPIVEKIVVAVEDGFENWSTSVADAVDYEDFIANRPIRFEWPDIDENSALGLCYTSGTTGAPKGVEYEHRSQYLHTMAICMADAMALSATDAICGIVPMFHAMGWGIPWSALMLGCKQVMPHRFMDPARLLRLIADERVTMSAGVPTIWQGVKAVLEANPDDYDLTRLSRVTCGGSAPPPSMIRWYWDTLGVEMIQGWGLTETSPLATLSRRVMKHADRELSIDAQFENVAKAGQLIPGLELDIFDDAFRPLPHDGKSTGEILIRGPWDLFGVLQESPAGTVPGRLVDHRRCRQDRRGRVSHHLLPLEGPGEERRRVDLFGGPRESSRGDGGSGTGVRRRATAPEVGRTPSGADRSRRGCRYWDGASHRALRDAVRQVATTRRRAVRRIHPAHLHGQDMTRRRMSALVSRRKATGCRSCGRTRGSR